jgi:single-stranded-DNA-specific exonuclease
VRIRRREPAGPQPGGLHPVVARALAARGVHDAGELDPSLSGMLAPTMAGLDAAVERLVRALADGEPILVVGDFDADGATSVALAVRALRAFGHRSVDYLVPNRFEYGYGLTPELVGVIGDPAPGLILTVDNGVASHEGVAAARERGIDTVVTDHHLPGDELPDAVAVVNPNRPDCPFASKHLAGVGVLFYLLVALRGRLEAQGHFAERGGAPRLAAFLDLVALGTVADVVRLDRNNRILVEQGLRRIRAGQGCAGIRALLKASRRDPARVTAADLGFAVGPRLNAAGRLDDMAHGIETLLADTPEEAAPRAERLEALNRERREIEAEMREQAEAELERIRASLQAEETLPAGITLHDPRWHQGVIGILAGRVRESIHRPTVVFAEAGEAADDCLKGSARSIPGLHVRDVLAAIDTRHPGLIRRFGGHAMAAGLTVPRASLPRFRQAFTDTVAEMLGGTDPVHEVLTDGALAPDEITLATAEAIRSVGPWGAGFPEPVFDGRFEICSARIVGDRHLRMALRPETGEATVEAIAFGAADGSQPATGESVHIVYRLEVNEYRGRRTPQLVVEHFLSAGR